MRLPSRPRLSRAAVIVCLWPILATAAAAQTDWSLTVDAAMPAIRDSARLTVGSASGALAGLDPRDEPHPPAFPNRYLDLVIERRSSDPGWEAQAVPHQRYLADFQPPLTDATRTVDLWLETDTRSPVSLSWNRPANQEGLFSYDVYIEDVSAGARIDMRLQPFYDRVFEAGSHPMRLVFGPRDEPEVTPTPTPFIFATATPTPDFTPQPTPTVRPAGGWWELFEVSAAWRETEYTGPGDLNLDLQVTEEDLFEFFDRRR